MYEDILDLIETYQFSEARKSLSHGFKEVADVSNCWKYQLVTLLLEIKEQEYKQTLQESDILAAIKRLSSTCDEIIAMNASRCWLMLLTCQTNILNLTNALENDKEAINNDLFKTIAICLKKGLELNWNTPQILPTCIDLNEATNGLNIWTNIGRLLTLYGQNIQSHQDSEFLDVFASFLIQLAVFSLKSEREGLVQTLMPLIQIIVCSLDKKKDRTKSLKRMLFSYYDRQEIHFWLATIKQLQILPTSICSDTNATFKEIDAGDFNPLCFSIQALIALSNGSYINCLMHVEQVFLSAILKSKLTTFQHLLLQNIYNILAVKMEEENYLDFTSLTDDWSMMLNHMTFLFTQRKYGDHLLEKLERILSKCQENSREVYLVSNMEYILEKYLKRFILSEFPCVIHQNVKYFLYLDEIPKSYCFYLNAITNVKLNRHREASKSLKRLIDTIEEQREGGFDMECLYQQCCLCFLEILQNQKTIDMIGKLREKGISNLVWMDLFEGECYRRMSQFDQCITIWERGIKQNSNFKYADEFPKNKEQTLKGFMTKQYDTVDFLNNLAVAYMKIKKPMKAFQNIKNAILTARRQKVPIDKKLAFNYCKWLHDQKSRELAVQNWKEFNTTTLPVFVGEYEVSL